MNVLERLYKVGKLSQDDYLLLKKLEAKGYEIKFSCEDIDVNKWYVTVTIPPYNETEFDALSAAIKQVDSIRFSPIQIINHFNIFNLDKIEKELGMPQGYLSKAIKNKRALPKEWDYKLKQYLINLAKNINEKMA